jgi:NAD(P)-dependent dehydrogenase (short-subunit alcohol dehydrogenase family)
MSMIKPKIIVTSATGKTGSIVVTKLLKAGYPVRALVHREDGRSARLKAQGSEIAVADMSDVERVADALKHVQRAYYCPPIDPYMIQGAAVFAVAAKEARLGIARRYAALPRNQRNFRNWLREFAQFMVAPLSRGFNLDRYDRELRRPFPSAPQFATDSKVWRREHAIADNVRPPAPVHGKAPIAATSRGQSLEY